MKKYVKPELFYEQFELSTHIANCIFEAVNSAEPGACAFVGDADSDWPNYVIFTSGTEGCELETEVACYYTGAGGLNTFDS